MSMAHGFPAGLRYAAARRVFNAGAVVKLIHAFDDGRPREKRFVIAHVTDERLHALVINSRISDYLRSKPLLLACQVTMQQAAHPFMEWDSHVDCATPITFATARAVQQLVDEPKWDLGKCTDELRHRIVAGLKDSPIIRSVDLQAYVASLEAANL
jgi:hypothetical protein